MGIEESNMIIICICRVIVNKLIYRGKNWWLWILMKSIVCVFILKKWCMGEIVIIYDICIGK